MTPLATPVVPEEYNNPAVSSWTFQSTGSGAPGAYKVSKEASPMTYGSGNPSVRAAPAAFS